ncbi:MAG: hypothetical protein AAB215_07070 [Planctomycetota bacterium]
MKGLHSDQLTPVYLSTVMDGNHDARATLTSGRAGLPHYLDHGRYFTYAINLNRRRRHRSAGVAVRRGEEVGLDRLLGFLRDVGSRRQFFPALETADFGTDYLR